MGQRNEYRRWSITVSRRLIENIIRRSLIIYKYCSERQNEKKKKQEQFSILKAF